MTEADEQGEMIKLVVVGDHLEWLKTKLLISYAKNEFPEDYIPTVFDNYNAQIEIDEKEYTLGLWDTAGQEDHDKLRPLSYPGTHVFVVIFSSVNRPSFNNVQHTWIPEIKKHCRGTPILLANIAEKTADDEKRTAGEPVTDDEALLLVKKQKLVGYYKANCYTKEGLKELFDEALLAVLYPQNISPWWRRILKKPHSESDQQLNSLSSQSSSSSIDRNNPRQNQITNFSKKDSIVSPTIQASPSIPIPPKQPLILPVTSTRYYQALYDFQAQDNDTLSFQANDQLTVLRQTDSAWWWGELNGKQGYVPSIYLKPLSKRLSSQQTLLKPVDKVIYSQVELNEKLLSAARVGDLISLKKWLHAGADLQATDEGGRMILHIAAFKGYTTLVSYLLEQKPDIIETTDKKLGRTALHLAAFNGQEEAVRLLVKLGADVSAVIQRGKQQGKTAEQLARENHHHGLADYLHRCEARIRLALERMEQEQRSKVQIAQQKGMHHLKAGNLAEAMALFNEAISLVPDNGEAILGLAQIYEANQEYARALRCYTQLVDNNTHLNLAQEGCLRMRFLLAEQAREAKSQQQQAEILRRQQEQRIKHRQWLEEVPRIAATEALKGAINGVKPTEHLPGLMGVLSGGILKATTETQLLTLIESKIKNACPLGDKFQPADFDKLVLSLSHALKKHLQHKRINTYMLHKAEPYRIVLCPKIKARHILTDENLQYILHQAIEDRDTIGFRLVDPIGDMSLSSSSQSSLVRGSRRIILNLFPIWQRYNKIDATQDDMTDNDLSHTRQFYN